MECQVPHPPQIRWALQSVEKKNYRPELLELIPTASIAKGSTLAKNMVAISLYYENFN
jgi:hypothetical protein